MGPVFKNLEMVHIFVFWTLIIELFMVCGPDRLEALKSMTSKLGFSLKSLNSMFNILAYDISEAPSDLY